MVTGCAVAGARRRRAEPRYRACAHAGGVLAGGQGQNGSFAIEVRRAPVGVPAGLSIAVGVIVSAFGVLNVATVVQLSASLGAGHWRSIVLVFLAFLILCVCYWLLVGTHYQWRQ